MQNKYPFQNPEDIYRGLDLWMVNDRLEDQEIAHQVEEFKKKGLYSVIFRTYDGLISDYPDKDFKHKLRIAVETAKRCGLKIVLQAGYMPAAIPELPEEYCLHRIFPVKEDELTGSEHILTRYGGIAYTEKNVPCSLNMLDEKSIDYYLKKTYEEMWDEFSDEYGKTIISVWVDEPRFENRYLTWTSDLGDIFENKYGYPIEPEIPSLYLDIGDYKKIRYDYFTLLRDIMANGYYSKVREWCKSKGLTFSGHLMAEERLQMQIAQSVAVMPYYKYFDIPGIDNLRCNHDWYDKPMKGHTKWHELASDKARFMGAVQCVSAAEQAGKEHILCEMYGVTSPSFVFRDMMHLFDFFAVHGINHQCMHALFYSNRGFRKRFYPQTFNDYQPYWENFRNIKDYVSRVSKFVSMGKCTKDVLVLHPLETAYGIYRGLTDINDESCRNDVIDYDNRYYKFITDLYSMQINWHLGDLATIEQIGGVCGEKFVIGRMSYKTVVLPEIETLTSKMLTLLQEFANNGGNIYICGNIPSRLDGRYCDSLADTLINLPNVQIFESKENLLRALRKLERPFKYECEDDASQTYINHRTEGNNCYFMICNGDCKKSKRGTLTIDGTHKVFRFDAEHNTVNEFECKYENNKTVVHVQIDVGGSILLFTEENGVCERIYKNKDYRVVSAEMPTCKIDSENVLTLELCTYKTEDMDEFSDKEIAIERVVEKLKREKYTGNITLRFKFYSDICAKALTLLIEDPEECNVSFNGVPVDMTDRGFYYSKAFRKISLPDVTRCGENAIDISRYTTPQVNAKINDDMKHLFELFRAPKGTDLERIHILGNFCVEALPEYPTGGGIVRYAKHFFMTEKKPIANASDITSHGYPFYPGVVKYNTSVAICENMADAEDVLFVIGVYNGCTATVYVNGKKAGYIDREPYKLSIKDFIIKGHNNIEVHLYGTFRNMIGPSHVEGMDPCGCNRDMWILDFDCTECTEYDNQTLTNSFQLVPYGIGNFIFEII